LWVSAGVKDFTQIVNSVSYIERVTWAPGEHRMFFIADYSLYMASAPDFTPILVSPPELDLGDGLINPVWIP
jgi:hypothetical protein